MYARYIKRPLDFLLSLCAIIVLSPVYLVLMIIGAVAMKGNPFFLQYRPGKNEKVFSIIKFRTMTCEKDKNGKPLPDDIRLTKYGRFLRSTSLDELPELFNILKGDMAIIGPRPLIIRDVAYMTDEQRQRYTVRPGLSGLAQVNGRNSIRWEDKLAYDLQYIKKITFLNDMALIFKTVKVTICREGITPEGMDTTEDFGDYLFRTGAISESEFERCEERCRVMCAAVNAKSADTLGQEEYIPVSASSRATLNSVK